jgi:glycosyltransferase involved in cell wall biosynthesis
LQRCGNDVRYLGFRSDVANLLAISDIFVLPSYLREGVPRVLLEAGAMGLPLITTNMPGCREVVRDGWNGCLVPPRNGRRLAQAILSIANSPAQRTLMGQRSESHIRETFALNKVAAAYAAIYHQALTDSVAAGPQQLRRSA